VTVDGREVDTFVPKTETWGRLYANIPAGKHTVYAKLMDTPARTIGNVLTILAWGLFIVVVASDYKNKTK
jgi:hypothetical protein